MLQVALLESVIFFDNLLQKHGCTFITGTLPGGLKVLEDFFCELSVTCCWGLLADLLAAAAAAKQQTGFNSLAVMGLSGRGSGGGYCCL